MDLQVFEFEGSPIQFTKEGWVNATAMAARYGKTPKDWRRTDRASAFIEAVSTERQICLTDLVKTIQGGTNQGTWLHPDLAIEFARWLDPRFGLWCDLKIRDLLTTSQFQIPQTLSEALQLAADKQKKIEQDAPKVDAYEKLMNSETLYTVSDFGKTIGWKPRKFLNHLVEQKVLMRRGGKGFFPYAQYQNWFTTKESVLPHGGLYTTCYVKPNGQGPLANKYGVIQ
jgi:phage antirepressor YoqD-like protein